MPEKFTPTLIRFAYDHFFYRLVTESCSQNAFLSKIEMSSKASYKDNRERFRGGYDDLVDTLSVC